MSVVELSAESAAAVGQVVADRMVAMQMPVWSREEVARFTPFKSGSSQSRFFKAHGIVPCARGLYSRAKVEQALNKLSKQRYASA